MSRVGVDDDERTEVPVVVGVLLAAGAGTRYGGPKILAAQGEWLRCGVRSLADGGCSEVLVTVGAAEPHLPVPARAVRVPRWRDGLSESVRAGLIRAGEREGLAGVVLHVVDIPDVTAGQVARLLAAAGPTPSSLARATHAGKAGHPVYIGADHIEAVLDSLSGDRGAGRYLATRDDVIDVDCSDLGSGIDHDYPNL